MQRPPITSGADPVCDDPVLHHDHFQLIPFFKKKNFFRSRLHLMEIF